MAKRKKTKANRPKRGKAGNPHRARAAGPRLATGYKNAPPKISAPRAHRLYARERLFNLLDRTREDHRVIWVSAPGGAGKTSLATSYLDARRLPTLWYQVDHGDGDIASFFYYMGLAARRAAPRHRKPLPVLTPEYLADVPTFTRNFFRELYRRLPKGAVIVLDNYQDAPEESQLHDVLHIAMSEIPDGLNLVALSRVEPPAVLARLRLCDHAACLDWGKMQLTPEETAGLGALRTGGKGLDGETVQTLQHRTQGWAAGVVLMLEQARDANAFGTAPASADQGLLFHYFAGEVLHRSLPETQAFLLKTVLFPKFTAAQAETLTGHSNAREILEDLTRRNYFTVRHLAQDDTYYEYHPLFREFLLERAREQFAPEAFTQLQQQAARLLADAGNTEAAVALLTQAQDWSGLVPIILQNAPHLAQQGRLQTLAEWLRPLPESLLDSVPWLQYWLGTSILGVNPGKAIALFNAAYENFDRERETAGALLCWAGAVNAISFEMQDYSQFEPWLARLNHITTTYPVFPSAEIEAQVTASALIGIMWRNPAHPSTGYWFDHALKMMHTCSDPRARTLLGFYRHVSAQWYYASISNDAHEIEKNLAGVFPHLEGAPLEQLLFFHLQISCLLFRLETGPALRVMEQALAIADRSGVHVEDAMIVGLTAAVCLGAGDLVLADELLVRMQKSGRVRTKLDWSFYWYLLAWRAGLGEQFELACDQMTRSLEVMDELNALPVYTLGLLARAEYQIAAGDLAAARAALAHADDFLRGSPAGIIRLLNDCVATQLAFAEGDEARGLERLRHWLESIRRSGVLCVLGNLAEPAARLCARALTHGIEVDTARTIIRQRRLTPPDNTLPEHWPWQLRLYTLGRFGVVKDETPLKAEGKGSRKPLELLKALVAFGGRDVPEQRLSEALWPGAEGDAAHQAFATTLHRLRKLLGTEDLIRLEGNQLSLDPKYVWVDAWAFERGLAPAQDRASVEQTLALYNGPFLGGEELAFALPLRERLRSKFLRAVAEQGARYEQSTHPDQAIACYHKGLEVDPLAEELYRRLMQCYRKLNRHSEALAVYQRCEQNLTTLLGVAPSAETQSLYKEILAAAR